MTQQTESRRERKQRTRQAILDAALDISSDQGMAGLSLRQVAKQVGIAPTAFYRHFDTVNEVGLTLVDDSFRSLRAMLRDIRRETVDVNRIIPTSIAVLSRHVHEHHQHFQFVARERFGGPPAVREAIAHQLELVTRELATDLARLTGANRWSTEDLHLVSEVIVETLVSFSEKLLRTSPAGEQALLRTAEKQIQMLVIGARNWRSD